MHGVDHKASKAFEDELRALLAAHKVTIRDWGGWEGASEYVFVGERDGTTDNQIVVYVSELEDR